jgi:hypothetical protein
MNLATEQMVTTWSGPECIPAEGPVEHIRNALQIVNGVSYMLEARAAGASGSEFDVDQLLHESLAALEHRLSAALTALVHPMIGPAPLRRGARLTNAPHAP